MELSALESLKKYPHRLIIMRKMVFPPFLGCFQSNPFDTF